MVRKLYLWLGLLSLAIGFVGVFLPLIPTTPLILLSGFFFSRSSPKFHSWLRSHRRFGPLLQDWEQGQVIRPRAKVASLLLMFALVGYSTVFVLRSPYPRLLLIVVSLAVALFVLTRPSEPPTRDPS